MLPFISLVHLSHCRVPSQWDCVSPQAATTSFGSSKSRMLRVWGDIPFHAFDLLLWLLYLSSSPQFWLTQHRFPFEPSVFLSLHNSACKSSKTLFVLLWFLSREACAEGNLGEGVEGKIIQIKDVGFSRMQLDPNNVLPSFGDFVLEEFCLSLVPVEVVYLHYCPLCFRPSVFLHNLNRKLAHLSCQPCRETFKSSPFSM